METLMTSAFGMYVAVGVAWDAEGVSCFGSGFGI